MSEKKPNDDAHLNLRIESTVQAINQRLDLIFSDVRDGLFRTTGGVKMPDGSDPGFLDWPFEIRVSQLMNALMLTGPAFAQTPLVVYEYGVPVQGIWKDSRHYEEYLICLDLCLHCAASVLLQSVPARSGRHSLLLDDAKQLAFAVPGRLFVSLGPDGIIIPPGQLDIVEFPEVRVLCDRYPDSRLANLKLSIYEWQALEEILASSVEEVPEHAGLWGETPEVLRRSQLISSILQRDTSTLLWIDDMLDTYYESTTLFLAMHKVRLLLPLIIDAPYSISTHSKTDLDIAPHPFEEAVFCRDAIFLTQLHQQHDIFDYDMRLAFSTNCYMSFCRSIEACFAELS